MRKPEPVVKIEDTFITNVPRGKAKPPEGEPWRAYLCGWTAKGRRDVVELRAATQDELDRMICDFVEAGVEVVNEVA